MLIAFFASFKTLTRGRMARQCLCRTAANDQVRGGLPACLCVDLRGAGIHREVSWLLQWQETAFVAGREDARSGLPQCANAYSGGGITKAEIPLRKKPGSVQTTRATPLSIPITRASLSTMHVPYFRFRVFPIEAVRHTR